MQGDGFVFFKAVTLFSRRSPARMGGVSVDMGLVLLRSNGHSSRGSTKAIADDDVLHRDTCSSYWIAVEILLP